MRSSIWYMTRLGTCGRRWLVTELPCRYLLLAPDCPTLNFLFWGPGPGSGPSSSHHNFMLTSHRHFTPKSDAISCLRSAAVTYVIHCFLQVLRRELCRSFICDFSAFRFPLFLSFLLLQSCSSSAVELLVCSRCANPCFLRSPATSGPSPRCHTQPFSPVRLLLSAPTSPSTLLCLWSRMMMLLAPAVVDQAMAAATITAAEAMTTEVVPATTMVTRLLP